MLVLTRRIGDEIVIAGNIRVTVVAVNGSRVRLGFTAPDSVTVTRGELLAEPRRCTRAVAAAGSGHKESTRTKQPISCMGDV
jgi:carbon storage regulator